MNNRNICNTCAPHTAGEACLAPTIAPVARTLNLYLRLGCFFAPKGQQNSAQGNALGGTETHIFAPCKGSKITSIALLLQGFVGARHASPLQSRLWRELLTSTFASGVFSPRRGQQNSAQGNALGDTETHILAPCKGSKITSIALPPQGFVGARHASPANAVRIVSISLFGRGTPRP